MNRKHTKIGVSLIAIFTLISAPMDSANAGILNWFKEAINGKQELGSTASSNNLYLSPELVFAGKITEQKELAKLDVVQNSSIVQSSNPYGINILQPASVVQYSNNKVAREMTIPASAYSSTPDQTDDSPFITANGAYVYDGLVAANFLPFGTKIKIPDIYGDKIFTVEDRMNRRYWHKVDIWFPDRESALQFGIRTVRIQILES